MTLPVTKHTFYLAWVSLAIVLGLGLRWHALDGAFFADDYDHYAMHAGIYPLSRGPFDMFDFVGEGPAEHAPLLRSGRLPWWTYPGVHLAVLRPLASALIAFDFWLSGASPWGFHLHSMLWWVVLLAGVAALLRSTLPLPVAALGVLIYALDEAHGLPLSWIANRSAIVAVALCCWGLWAHVAARQGTLRRGRALSLLLVALALLAGEHAFAGLAYFAAFELWGMRGALTARLRALLPVAALGTTYLLVRAGLGYGIAGSGFYIDPLTTPLRYAAAAMTRLPLLLGDLLFGLGAEWEYAGPPWREWLLKQDLLPPRWLALSSLQRLQLGAGVAAGVVALGLLWVLGRAPLRARAPGARWLLLGGLLSILPMCSTLPMSRLCLGAAIGIDAMLALLLCAAVGAALQRGLPRRWPARLGFALLALPLIFVHLVYAGVRARRDVGYYAYLSRVEDDWVEHAEIDDAKIAGQQVFVIAGRDWPSQWALPFARHLHGHPMPERSALLSAAFDNPHVLLRRAARVLELRIEGAPVPATFSGSVYRPEVAPLRPGQRFAGAGFRVEILAAAGGQPTRLRFTFALPLDDPGYLFLYPREDGLRRVRMPAVGQRLRLPAPAVPHFSQRATSPRASDPAG